MRSMSRGWESRTEKFRRAVAEASVDSPRATTSNDDNPQLESVRTRSILGLGISCLLALTSLLLFLRYGTFLYQPDVQWRPVVSYGTVLGGSLYLTWYVTRRTNRSRARTAVLSAFFLACVLSVIGATTQLVIDGRPVLNTSTEKRAHDIVQDLYSDVLAMSRADELLAKTDADARAHFNSYEPASKEIQQIANKWARADLGDLPDPALIEVVQHVKNAASIGSQALDLRLQSITEPDSRTTTAYQQYRSDFIAETLAGAAKLKPLAELYRVDILPGGGE